MIDYNSMPAGAEMDALIAERVMGFKRYRDRDTGGVYLLENPSLKVWEQVEDNANISSEQGLDVFSTDIRSAWRVVRKMCFPIGSHSFNLDYADVFNRGTVWSAEFYGVAFGETAALAICRAALKASKR